MVEKITAFNVLLAYIKAQLSSFNQFEQFLRIIIFVSQNPIILLQSIFFSQKSPENTILLQVRSNLLFSFRVSYQDIGEGSYHLYITSVLPDQTYK